MKVGPGGLRGGGEGWSREDVSYGLNVGGKAREQMARGAVGRVDRGCRGSERAGARELNRGV